MSKFRKIYATFWADDFVEMLTPEQRYFYLFLLTNPHVGACGIYQITMRKMEFLTGYNCETVQKLLNFFIEKGKIKYQKDHSELLISNWAKYNLSRGGTPVYDCLRSELQHIKNQSFIAELAASIGDPTIKKIYDSYHDSSTIRGQDREGEGEGEGDINDDTLHESSIKEIITYLNEKTESNFSVKTKKSKGHILARLKEGYLINDFKLVVDHKARQWLGTDQADYLRPSTLFGTKFEGYLQAARRAKAKKAPEAKELTFS